MKGSHLLCDFAACECAAEIILIDNIVSVYRSGSDVTMHVIGSAHEVCCACLYPVSSGTLLLTRVCFLLLALAHFVREQSELILLSVLDATFEAASSLLKYVCQRLLVLNARIGLV